MLEGVRAESDGSAVVSGLELVELVSCDVARKRARTYRVRRAQTLFERYALVITWGRIGWPPRERTETFDDELALERRFRELLARRRQHGYTVAFERGRADARGVPTPSTG